MDNMHTRASADGYEANRRNPQLLEKEKQELILDMIQLILDLTGMVEATPFSDGTNALISLARRNWGDALISTVSIVPYFGDLAKVGKLNNYAYSIRRAIKIAEKDGVWGIALKQFLSKIKKLLDELIEILGDNTPDGIKIIRHEIERFLPSALKGGAGPGQRVSKAGREKHRPQKSTRKQRRKKEKDEPENDNRDDIIDGDGGKNTKPTKPLLPKEGSVDTYSELVKKGSKGDNLTPHHMPADSVMKEHGVKRKDGVSMNIEQPTPGTGGRHRRTRTYGRKADLSETPREALARDIKDSRKIYKEDGVYTPEIRKSHQDVIQKNKELHPQIFKK